MKTIFYLDEYPQYLYITEEQAQVEYCDYMYKCGDLYKQGLINTTMWLSFHRWLKYMEYFIY